MLIIQTERGAVMVEPIGRLVMGPAGRIDLYAHPTLFRVMLLWGPEHRGWRIRTDSGVFLRQPWKQQTFLELLEDLTAAT